MTIGSRHKFNFHRPPGSWLQVEVDLEVSLLPAPSASELSAFLPASTLEQVHQWFHGFANFHLRDPCRNHHILPVWSADNIHPSPCSKFALGIAPSVLWHFGSESGRAVSTSPVPPSVPRSWRWTNPPIWGWTWRKGSQLREAPRSTHWWRPCSDCRCNTPEWSDRHGRAEWSATGSRWNGSTGHGCLAKTHCRWHLLHSDTCMKCPLAVQKQHRPKGHGPKDLHQCSLPVQ